MGLLFAAWAAIGSAEQPPPKQVTRADMLRVAGEMAAHTWTARAANLKAACVASYRTRWSEDQVVTGVAYDWGGMDTTARFSSKLAAGLAAGSHSDEGVTACTTGVDCSGFVSLCWNQTTKFGTSNLDKIADRLTGIDVTKDLKPGDVLNKSSVHVVLFDSYNPDGTLNVYEASGGASRVILSRNVDFVKYKTYEPMRYRGAVD